ncbi:MAG: tetratricopeptide repeat protein, partial [Myxococcota bacterium]
AETLETLVSYNPDYVTAQRNLGFIYGKLGRNREAISQMQKYLGMDPEADDRAHIETVIAKLRQNP